MILLFIFYLGDFFLRFPSVYYLLKLSSFFPLGTRSSHSCAAPCLVCVSPATGVQRVHVRQTAVLQALPGVRHPAPKPKEGVFQL